MMVAAPMIILLGIGALVCYLLIRNHNLKQRNKELEKADEEQS